jgi:phosphate transport system protein
MASQLETELTKLTGAIIKINDLAESQVVEAMKALISGPLTEAKKEVRKTEHKIDKLDVKIEEICQHVFALQQPVASDLRFIMSAMQISNLIESIGDLALAIIKKSKNINERDNLIPANNISTIAIDVESIAKKTNLCFQTRDENILGEIFLLGNVIPKKVEKAVQAIVEEMQRSPQSVLSGTSLIIVLKYMEAIAMHCTNIGKMIYFMVHARIIKHGKPAKGKE